MAQRNATLAAYQPPTYQPMLPQNPLVSLHLYMGSLALYKIFMCTDLGLKAGYSSLLGNPLLQILMPSSTPLQVSWCMTSPASIQPDFLISLGMMQRTKWGWVECKLSINFIRDSWKETNVYVFICDLGKYWKWSGLLVSDESSVSWSQWHTGYFLYLFWGGSHFAITFFYDFLVLSWKQNDITIM